MRKTIVHSEHMDLNTMHAEEIHQIYNVLDTCVTLDVYLKIKEQMGKETSSIYQFERALQAPVMEMQLTGVYVDMVRKAGWITTLTTGLAHMQLILNRYAEAIWGKELNPNSPAQMKDFFFSEKGMNLPPIYSYKKGIRTLSVDRETLEQLQQYFYAKPIVLVVLAMREARKKRGVLLTGIDEDNRLRSSYNIAGTETGRFSSSGNSFGTGTNFQNITENLRKIFVADPGMKLAYIDLEQAESRLVGLLSWLCSGSSGYLDACESGDLHTVVARMVWPDLAWTGDLAIDRKQIADQVFYRDFSYRDMAKRGGHGTNYYGKPMTMAKHLKVETKLMETFQQAYFAKFPEIRQWHHHTAKELQTKGILITPVGRKRQFFGRLGDDTTLRTAIAYVPQSTIADLMNLGMYRVWKANCCQILAQVHDALLIQYPENQEDIIIPQVRKLLEVEIEIKGRKFSIPTDATSGWNFSKYDYKNPEKNPDGQKGYNKHDSRERKSSPSTNLLDTILS